jgi:small redox-active disulfide protein 2
MNVKVLGSGCANCKTLEARTTEALTALGIEAEIEKVTDYADIASWGVMSTPALVVDDRVVLTGRVPLLDELAALLEGAGA